MVRYLLLALALLAGPSIANIFVKDNRVQKDPNDPSLPPIKSVGIILNQNANSHGSAWIVRDPRRSGCYVATNYHVGFAKSVDANTGATQVGRAKVGAEVTFAIGADLKKPGSFTDVVKAKAVDFGVFNKNNWFGMRDDWAIFKLETCMGDKYGSLAYARPTESQPMPHGDLVVVGYPASRSNSGGVTVEIGCKAQDHGPIFGLIGVDCAFEGGGSGGPVLENLSGEWLVVGMVSYSTQPTREVLPRYTADHRNQVVYSSAFFKAFDRVLGYSPNQDQVPLQQRVTQTNNDGASAGR